jgi:hypothetical protein
VRRDHQSIEAAIDRGEPVILVTTTARNVEPSIRRPAQRLRPAGRFERELVRVLTTPELAPATLATDPEPRGAAVLRAVEWLGGQRRQDPALERE